ncbi:hypothetical protein WMY93_003113 [Mugilogobius chulae]|uniref:Uncharacterized protein n=1 Tax=Mugilogobius chulae TaxID=88201 RepID=A0AAW0Q5J0_9GOBI
MPTVEFSTGSIVSMTPKKKTFTSEVYHPNLLSSQPIIACLQCLKRQLDTPRGPVVETAIQGQGKVFIKDLKRDRPKEELYLAKTRSGPVASMMQKRDNSSSIIVTIWFHPHTTTTIPTHISSSHSTSNSTHCPGRSQQSAFGKA